MPVKSYDSLSVSVTHILESRPTVIEHLLFGVDTSVVGDDLGGDLLSKVLGANAAVQARLRLSARARSGELMNSLEWFNNEVNADETHHAMKPCSQANIPATVVGL